MFKKILIFLLLLISYQQAFAVTNCYEEVSSNIYQLQKINNIAFNYFDIGPSDDTDSHIFKSHETVSEKYNAIETIESLCEHDNIDFLPIAKGLIGGKYYVMYKGLVDNDSLSYQIHMVIYDLTTLRRQSVVVESYTQSEGRTIKTNSELKEGAFNFTAYLVGDFTSKPHVITALKSNRNEAEYQEDRNTGILRRCPYYNQANFDDLDGNFNKGDRIYHCSEKREGTLSLATLFDSQANWEFDTSIRKNDYKDPVKTRCSTFKIRVPQRVKLTCHAFYYKSWQTYVIVSFYTID